MKVSIIIPVYNCEKYIKKCIESIKAQTYKNWELILIDDASKDKSGRICDEYAEKNNNIYVYHIENNGPANARNTGLSYAKGTHCMFVDADDYIEKNALEILSNIIQEENQDIIFYCNYNEGYYNGEFIQNNNKVLKLDINSNEDMKKNFNLLFDEFYTHPVWNKLYDKSFIDKVGAKFPFGINSAEDFIFNMELYQNVKKAKVIDKILYHYVKHDGESISSTFNKEKFNGTKYVYEKEVNILEKWNPESVNKFKNFFIKDINININSLFNKDCNLIFTDKKNYVKGIVNDLVVKECLENIECENIRNKITAFLLKKRFTLLLLLMGKVTRMIKRH